MPSSACLDLTEVKEPLFNSDRRHEPEPPPPAPPPKVLPKTPDEPPQSAPAPVDGRVDVKPVKGDCRPGYGC